jgi:hypothetical protein
MCTWERAWRGCFVCRGRDTCRLCASAHTTHTRCSSSGPCQPLLICTPAARKAIAVAHCVLTTTTPSALSQKVCVLRCGFQVMLALNSNLLGQGGQEFDLVLSGINRGDNCGLHVIYSGTVGAAREAACKVRATRHATCSTLGGMSEDPCPSSSAAPFVQACVRASFVYVFECFSWGPLCLRALRVCVHVCHARRESQPSPSASTTTRQETWQTTRLAQRTACPLSR